MLQMFFFFLQWGCLLFWYKYCIMYLKHVLASHTDKVVAHENRADLNMDSLIWFPFFSARPPLSRAVRAQGWEGFSSPLSSMHYSSPNMNMIWLGKKYTYSGPKRVKLQQQKTRSGVKRAVKAFFPVFLFLLWRRNWPGINWWVGKRAWMGGRERESRREGGSLEARETKVVQVNNLTLHVIALQG